ncbi:MAG: hypothetical protein U0872_02655 [Planctomycetaceae bacterium]
MASAVFETRDWRLTMSAAGAVQMGSAFVRFFGDATDLFKSLGALKNNLSEFAGFSRESSAEISAVFDSVGSSASRALTSIAVDTTAASNSAAGATGAITGAASGMTTLGAASSQASSKLSGVPSIFNAIKAGAGGLCQGCRQGPLDEAG